MRTLSVVILLVCAGTSAGFAQADSDAASKVTAMEHVWAQALTARDPNALDRILDAAFVCVGADGKLLTKSEILAGVKRSTALQVLTEPMVVRLHGDTAVVTGTFRTKGVERGKPFARKKRFVDTWLRRNGQWMSVTSLVTPASD